MSPVEREALTELELELLESLQAGETTTCLHEQLLESPPDRATIEITLRGLLDRGFLTTKRGLDLAPRGIYEDDWWDLTLAGRNAIGLPPRSRARWMNPSSGRWRVGPLMSLWCRWRLRRGKRPHPDWWLRRHHFDRTGR
jgi:hypothetical protein